MSKLTHLDSDGRARMVDVTEKSVTHREAIASGCVRMEPATLSMAVAGDNKKGDPIAIAELAGIMATKRTADLIPLCHPLPITSVKVKIEKSSDRELEVTASVKTAGQTGVEMEALTAVSVACLTLYDMLKAIDKSMVIESIKLLKKTGGKSGTYERTSD